MKFVGAIERIVSEVVVLPGAEPTKTDEAVRFESGRFDQRLKAVRRRGRADGEH